MAVLVELGIPYTGWPLRQADDYNFGVDRLSSELKTRILAWSADFNANFDEEKGWSSESARRSHALEAQQLQGLVQEQLGRRFEVVLDPLGAGLT